MTTKSDVLDLLNNFIHTSSPTRSKLSVHLRSQYKGFKFDPSSATPLIEAFTKHSIPVDESALTALIGSSPDLEKVKEFATAAVEKTEELEAEGKREVLTLIAGLKGKEAGERTNEELEARVREGNVWIEDINLFKAGLTPSKAAMPLEPIKAVAKL
jgi:insulysin